MKQKKRKGFSKFTKSCSRCKVFFVRSPKQRYCKFCHASKERAYRKKKKEELQKLKLFYKGINIHLDQP